MSAPAGRPRWVVAPAKLTVSLRVLGRRADGYHELEAEMVSLDLHDRLCIDPVAAQPGPAPGVDPDPGVGQAPSVEVVAAPEARASGLEAGEDNIVTRALAAAGRTARVRLEKRIPVGGGLGGGSTDAAAVLRWAGVSDLELAARIGADVPFCLVGGRALVRGIGEELRPLPFVPRAFVLLVPPFSVDTAAVYRAWDRLAVPAGAESPAGPAVGADQGPGSLVPSPGSRNDLTEAAQAVEPRLGLWGEQLSMATGRAAVLAGSGSTWWVEGTPDELGIADRGSLCVGRDEGRLIPVRTVPAGWTGPTATGDGAPVPC